MARWTEQNRTPVDDLIAQWREACLVCDGSLLTPNVNVWTAENVGTLVETFVNNELRDARSFDQKLAEQLNNQPAATVQLMAEVAAVYFAFASRRAATPEHKRVVIESILALHPDAPALEGVAASATDGAIGGPGQAFNRGRPFLFSYLIRFADALKGEEPDRRRELVSPESDPWAFKEWLDESLGEAQEGAQTMRNILLHLLFPDTFERIAVDEDKAQIVNAFAPLVDGLDPANTDVDRALFDVRGRLAELLPDGQQRIGGAIDFYYTPLRESWSPDDIGGEDRQTQRGLSHVAALEYKKQVVLYGPPGTGKTYEAKELASELIRRQALRRWGPVQYLQAQEHVEDLARTQVRRRQLHPAYSYEDFVAGLRLTGNETQPTKGDLLVLIDEIRDASAATDDPTPLPWVLILDELNRADLSRLLGEVFSALDDRGAPIELSAPGASAWGPLELPEDLYIIGTMNLIDQSVEQLDFALRRRFFWLFSGYEESAIVPVVKQRWEDLLEGGEQPWLNRHGWQYLQKDIELLAGRATALNGLVRESALLGPQYELGHTYFFEAVGFISRWPNLQPNTSWRGNYLWSSSGKALPPLRDLWTHSLLPLIDEYLAGVPSNARDSLITELGAAFLADVAK